MEHVLEATGPKRLDREFLGTDVGLHQRSQLRWQRTDLVGRDPSGSHRGRYFDRAARGQVVDQALVRHVDVHGAFGACRDAVDDLRRVFVAAGNFQWVFGVFEASSKLFPLGDLFLATPHVFAHRNLESLDEVRPAVLQEEGRVFGEVLAGLRDEVAETPQHFVADSITQSPLTTPGRVFRLPMKGSQPRVQVFPVVLQPQEEAHVIDACSFVVQFGDADAQVGGEVLRCDRHAVTEPVRLDISHRRQAPHVDRHRICVVEQPCLGAELADGSGDFQQRRHRPKPAHDSADSDGVCDRLLEAVSLGDLEVQDCCRFKTADLEHRDDEIGTFDGTSEIRRCHDLGARTSRLDQPMADDLRSAQSIGIDVVESDVEVVAQVGVREQVAHQIAREHRAPRPDECDCGHLPPLASFDRPASVFGGRGSRLPQGRSLRPNLLYVNVGVNVDVNDDLTLVPAPLEPVSSRWH